MSNWNPETHPIVVAVIFDDNTPGLYGWSSRSEHFSDWETAGAYAATSAWMPQVSKVEVMKYNGLEPGAHLTTLRVYLRCFKKLDNGKKRRYWRCVERNDFNAETRKMKVLADQLKRDREEREAAEREYQAKIDIEAQEREHRRGY